MQQCIIQIYVLLLNLTLFLDATVYRFDHLVEDVIAQYFASCATWRLLSVIAKPVAAVFGKIQSVIGANSLSHWYPLLTLSVEEQ